MHVCECLLSHSLLEKYPFDILPDTDLYAIHDVARSMLLKHKLVLDCKEGSNEPYTEHALLHVFHYNPPLCVSSGMADHPVPAPLLQEVLRYCQQPQQQPQDHKELRECLDKQNMFAGRNPLVSSVAACDIDINFVM